MVRVEMQRDVLSRGSVFDNQSEGSSIKQAIKHMCPTFHILARTFTSEIQP